MLFAKYLLLSAGIAMFVIAAGILSYDTYLFFAYRRRLLSPEGTPEATPAIGSQPRFRWRTSVALVMLAWAPLLVSAGIVIVPAGLAGVRVSQTQGTLAGTLYPGAHFVVPLVERVELFNTRDQLFTTGIAEDGLAKGVAKGEPLTVQTKEGLSLGLAITELPGRSQAAGLHRSAFAAAAGKGTRASHRRNRIPRTRSGLHGARSLFIEAGRGSPTLGRSDSSAPDRGRHQRQGGNAARYSAASGIRQGS